VVFKLADRTPEGTERPAKYTRVFDTLFGFFDAVGLAAFTVTGVRVAVQMQCDPLWLWGPLLAALTGAGGGILRDIVRADPDISALKRGLYAEIALVWGLLLSLFLGVQVRHISLDQVRNGILVALLGALITRLIILYRGWENPLQFNSRRTWTFRR
jgi:polar amino acid transport system substrate-binding protein